MNTPTIEQDDPIGTRDWEGPIPTLTRADERGATRALRRRTATPIASLLRTVERQARARPLLTTAAALGIGLALGMMTRSKAGRGLLVVAARRLAKMV